MRPLAMIMLAVLVIALTGCAAAVPAGGTCAGQPVAPPFDETVTTSHADNLAVHYVDGAAVVTVRQPYPGGAPETVVLTRCGRPAPRLAPALEGAPRVSTPVRSLYAASSTHLPMLDEVGRLDVLRGVASPAGIVSPAVRAGLADHRVVSFAPNGTTDVEAVLAARPDVLVTGGIEDPATARLPAAGVPVVPDAEWLERTPLGRAEWVKLFGLLTGTEDRAAGSFGGVAEAYDAVRAQVAPVPPTPVVAGVLASGAFNVPGGGSFVGALIRDAGGSYPWADRPDTGTLRVSLEEVLARAGSAPVWVTTATDWTTRDDARRADPRQGLLAAMGPGGRAWTASRARTPDGANDWFERGVTRPDLVLGDLAAALHPDRFPGHAFTFFTELTGP